MKKIAKLLSFLLAAVLCFGMLPASALALDTGDEWPDFSDGARLDLDTFNFVEGETLTNFLLATDPLPESFDLRHVQTPGGEVSYVTPVRLQNPYGTCWGYSAIGAAESSLLSSGLAALDGYDENTLDLSEKQVAFFATGYIDDPSHPQYGEGTHFNGLSPEDAYNYGYRYATGGMTYMATSLFASGTGPALERDPNGDPRDEMLLYQGANGEVTYWVAATEYDDDGKPVEGSYHQVPAWYSNQDDWSMPEEYRFVQDYRLRESIILPNPAGSDANGNYFLREEAIRAIKQQIAVEHRAVCVSFCAESYLPGQDTTGKLYMSENWAHFTNVFQNSNHSVTIVGYDDNYPASNFNSTTENGGSAQPEGNGAFLIKNSWGSELNDFPTNGYRHWGLLDGLDGVPYDPNAVARPGNKATGYFWISYYDRSLNDPEAFVFEKAAGDGGYIEQMDFMYSGGIGGTGNTGESKMANVFTAKATAKLTDISVFTVTPGTTVSYAVYLLGEGFADPTDGILIESGERTCDFGGYHRITLEDPRVLSKGQQYSVVIREEDDAINYVCYSIDLYAPDNDMYRVGVINPGESFYYSNGTWMDAAEESTKAVILSPYAVYGIDNLIIDNFPIKSYLEPITYPNGAETPKFNGYLSVNNWQDGNPGTFTMKVGEKKTLTAEFRGIGADMPATWDPSYEWEVTDDSLLTLSTSTPKRGQAVLTGLKPGVTQLIVYAGDDGAAGHPYPDNYGVRVLTIIVEPNPDDYDAFIHDTWIDTVEGVQFGYANIVCKDGVYATVYYAKYDADGRFLGGDAIELDPGDWEYSISFDDAAAVSFFVLNDAGIPLCPSETVEAEPAE